MITDGTTSIARTIPTNPSAQMAVAFTETAKDGLPHLIGSTAVKSQVKAARKAGDEYLNYQFGWLPLVSDVKKFAHSVLHGDEIMRGYYKGSSKKLRRSFEYPGTGGESSWIGGGFVDGSLALGGTAYVTDVTSQRRWFSGCFKYYVPISAQQQGRFSYYRTRAEHLLGLELTPEVMWNVAPWSWALDWFADTGDVLHNISRLGKDGLAMQYGYQMCHGLTSREISFIGTEPLIKGQTSYYKRTFETKQRIPASPYGFGISFEGLSNTQKAITVALGLTSARGRRSTDPYSYNDH
jgi:hypothetical protein